MAREVLTVAGTVVGAIYGYPQLGYAIGSALGNAVDPIVMQGNKIGDNPGQTASEGGTRAIVFGRGCIRATTVIARGDRKVKKKKESSGGKGGGPKVENEYVYWTFAIGLGEDLTGGSILRIWQDETLVYDVRPEGQKSGSENAEFARKFRFYDGNESQLPDPALQNFLGADTPYFRGTAYVVFPQFDLTNTAERIPQFRVEVVRAAANPIAEGFSNVSWDLDYAENGSLTVQTNAFSLDGNGDDVYTVGLMISGSVESRNYANVIDVLGGNGAFITAENPGSATLPNHNVYSLQISNPAQVYYFNHTPAALSSRLTFHNEPIEVQIASNATVTLVADPVDAFEDAPSQWMKAEVDYIGTDGVSYAPESLANIVRSLARRAEMVESNLDVSELTDVCVGCTFEQSVTGQEAIAATMQPYFADASEYDGKVRFIKRGRPVALTLTDDDLLEEPETQQRENVIEYPRKLHFFYQSPATGYATTKATSTRSSPNADVTGEASIAAPVTFDDANEPAQIAAKWHKVMWTEAQGEIIWKVADSHLALVPGDSVGLSLRGNVRRARIVKTEFEPGSITLTMREDRQSAYTSQVTGVPLPAPTPPQPTIMSKTVLLVLDIPALLDSDDELVYYTAMSGMTEIWTGAQLQRSLDDGASYSAIGDETSNAIIGTLQVALSAGTQDTIDDASVVRIQLYDPNDEINAISDAEFEAEGGAFALETATGWEVMQFRDAEDMGGGLYELSHLMRGRLNTSPDAHTVGQRFVLLDASIRKYSAQSSWIGTTLKHRGVSYGTSPEDADIVTTTFTGASQREWPVAGFSATYDGAWVSVTDIVPRHRFGTDAAPIPSVNWTGYRITASDGTNSVSVDTTNTSLLLDCSGIGTVTSVKVEQLNRITGPGQPATVAPTTVPAGTNAPTAVVNAGGSP